MPRQGLNADAVTRVAADLADREGLGALTVSAVARAVDVRPASLYAHVAGAEELRAGVALLALEELADAAGDAVAGRSGSEALTALAEAYRSYAREHPGRYAASRVRLDRETALRSAGPRHTALLASVLRGYAVPEDEHVHAVRLLGAAIHGFIELEGAGSFDHSRPSSRASWVRVLERLDAALRTWPTD
ncbi:TetR family transcriptional regulator [Aeromicrobium sp. Root495]|uniref:TetR/AcrR family transcriptional regulator n=1 Tax=Aeromicrobium sp. Root495 TaxID=1736550 RepID=UPI000700903D|nr:TetR-like C-terminal domain-containing protein [Aeromicrobium sp. Root495]KQY60548.1 TetR family transcriptional regulator [Aeromicrobium sp. Root495]